MGRNSNTVQGLYSFEFSKFHPFPWPHQWFFWVFHDLCYAVFLKVLSKVFSHVLMHKMHSSVNFLLEWKPVFRLFQKLIYMTHTSISRFSRPGKIWDLKLGDFPGFPWPVQTRCSRKYHSSPVEGFIQQWSTPCNVVI